MSKTISKNNGRLESIQLYWTKERRENAKAKKLPIIPKRGKEISPKQSTPKITPPNASIHDKNKDQTLDIGLAIPVEHPDEFPWICNGKLFFTWKGEDWVGSAGSILLEVLLTAGHNIYDEGEWSDNFLYYPGYPDYGESWDWSRATIFTAWMDDENYAYDYAMIHTDRPLTNSIGCIRDLSPRGRTWTAIGYPAEAPYGGEQMYKTTGDYVAGGNIITMNNNDMTRGSSGGNWLTKINGESFVNGVESHGEEGNSTYSNSPYIADKDYKKLLKCVTSDVCE